MLLDDLRECLIRNGYENVFVNQYPPKPDDMISLYERESPLGLGANGINYGARSAAVNIRIRRRDDDQCAADAWAIFAMLDSGMNEDDIQLSEDRSVTGRPSVPFFLERDDEERCVFVLKASIITSNP